MSGYSGGGAGEMIDWVEAGRMAHELSERHGPTAYLYAKRLADSAKAEGNNEEANFWLKVYGSLRPRNSN